MSEAEVSLRLADYLSNPERSVSSVQVAIDGAQIRIKDRIIFPLLRFMRDFGWTHKTGNDWRGVYSRKGKLDINIHSNPGIGDVVSELVSGNTLRVESKKGTLFRSKSSQEYPLMREAMGQLMTISEVDESDILAIAVPRSIK